VTYARATTQPVEELRAQLQAAESQIEYYRTRLLEAHAARDRAFAASTADALARRAHAAACRCGAPYPPIRAVTRADLDGMWGLPRGALWGPARTAQVRKVRAGVAAALHAVGLSWADIGAMLNRSAATCRDIARGHEATGYVVYLLRTCALPERSAER
jgi:hypothetical protein